MTFFEQIKTLTGQVGILFVLMTAGAACGRFGLITRRGTAQMTSLLVTLVTPCVMVVSFQTPFERDKALNLSAALALALAGTLTGAVLSALCIRGGVKDKTTVLRFSVMFSNCGFMGLPLLKAVLGDEGLFFGSANVAVFNLITWTWGVYMFTGKGSAGSLKKALLNPGVIGAVLSISLFAAQIRLPGMILTPVKYLPDMNTPLAMIIIGTYLSRVKLWDALKDRRIYMAAALRLLAVPLVMAGICRMLAVNDTLAVTAMVGAAAPTAVIAPVFAGMFKGDTALASKTVAVTTLISIMTIPLMIALVRL